MTAKKSKNSVAEAIGLIRTYGSDRFSMLTNKLRSTYVLENVVAGVLAILESGSPFVDVHIGSGRSVGNLKIPGAPRGARHVVLRNTNGIASGGGGDPWYKFWWGGSFKLQAIVVTVVPGRDDRNSITLIRKKDNLVADELGCVYIQIDRMAKVSVWDMTVRTSPSDYVAASVEGRSLHQYWPEIKQATEEYKIDQLIFPGAKAFVLENLLDLANYLLHAAPMLKRLARERAS